MSEMHSCVRVSLQPTSPVRAPIYPYSWITPPERLEPPELLALAHRAPSTQLPWGRNYPGLLACMGLRDGSPHTQLTPVLDW